MEGMEKWVRDAKRQDAHDREGILHGLVKGSPKSKKKRKVAFDVTRAFSEAMEEIERQRRGPMTDSEVEGLPGSGFENWNQPTITRSGMPEGRNPHVGLRIPALTASEQAARQRALRKRRGGTVRASNRR